QALMNPIQWKTHRSRKYSKANKGMQLIEMRNIR
ncbi:unnamed protein product, partial [Allacma fusca]